MRKACLLVTTLVIAVGIIVGCSSTTEEVQSAAVEKVEEIEEVVEPEPVREYFRFKSETITEEDYETYVESKDESGKVFSEQFTEVDFNRFLRTEMLVIFMEYELEEGKIELEKPEVSEYVKANTGGSKYEHILQVLTTKLEEYKTDISYGIEVENVIEVKE
ncbi:hypothetical protein [Bacillus suaedae]|uniref:Lipoprotein n=1 Tax=Halalkalibacter suaedae TaxID=2822140 RepID=A0A941AM73_9BACI|nr:hypothetical protein [Bacillus suaedae]MBP3950185.1 hypothetical protein [Bacillus suaedae]